MVFSRLEMTFLDDGRKETYCEQKNDCVFENLIVVTITVFNPTRIRDMNRSDYGCQRRDTHAIICSGFGAGYC